MSDSEIEKALDFLRDSAEEYAQWRAAEKYYEHQIKRIEAKQFVEQEKGAVEAKRMQARASEEYGECLENYHESKYNAELIGARRSAAEIKISFRQTQMKTDNQGY